MCTRITCALTNVCVCVCLLGVQYVVHVWMYPDALVVRTRIFVCRVEFSPCCIFYHWHTLSRTDEYIHIKCVQMLVGCAKRVVPHTTTNEHTQTSTNPHIQACTAYSLTNDDLYAQFTPNFFGLYFSFLLLLLLLLANFSFFLHSFSKRTNNKFHIAHNHFLDDGNML